VLLGNGAVEHRARLFRFADGFGVDAAELEDVLARLEQDPDAYFLSAEAHNRWRGVLPYDDFPMRRCVSVQFSLST
jgi:hypothetical protein